MTKFYFVIDSHGGIGVCSDMDVVKDHINELRKNFMHVHMIIYGEKVKCEQG